MIFNTIDNVNSKDDKALLIELVSVYCKIVTEYSKKIGISVATAGVSEKVIKEIKDMGLIKDSDQMTLLKKNLGDLFPTFINCVSAYVANPKSYGKILDKLSNKKRHQAQVKEWSENKPNMADFFAGAGGLSLGFSQSGYRVCFANDFQDVCVNTYRYNHPEVPSNKVLCADIRKIVDNQLFRCTHTYHPSFPVLYTTRNFS